MTTLQQHILEGFYSNTSSGLGAIIDSLCKKLDLDKNKFKENRDGSYDYDGNIVITDKNFTSLVDYFEGVVLDKVSGDFSCTYCHSLKTLEGSPKEVGVYFSCIHCTSLQTLIGASMTVLGWGFSCAYCTSLTTLVSAPQYIKGYFNCSHCRSLKSLEGAPKKDGDDFSCEGCSSLTSLVGAPKEVSKRFYCRGCKTKFTEEDVKKVSNVKRKIHV